MQLDVAGISIGLLGGLALFLFGMEQMTAALKVVAGASMRNVLGKLTTNRFSAAITGAFVTAVIQSSSVTTVLVVGFISAGVLTLSQSVGVIMGANIGTTITAQIIAFKVTKYAMVLIAVGFGGYFFSKRPKYQQIGAMIMGLGLIFFGMSLMSDATKPLRTYQPFIDLMKEMDNPLLGMLAGAAFTALVQSSSATTGIVIVLATQGFISLEAGIALALGANIGTCVTALLASVGKPREALRAAIVHVMFNVVGALIWVGFIGLLADLVRDLSPSHPELSGVARLAAESPRQIANAHTAFNIINTLAFLPFTVVLAKLAVRLAPDKPVTLPERARPQFLDEVYLETETAALAIAPLRKEVGRLGEIVDDLFGGAVPDRDTLDLQRIEDGVRDAHLLDRAILDYARRLSRIELGREESKLIQDLLAIANHFQNISDTVGINLRALAREWEEKGLRASEETRGKFVEFHGIVAKAIGVAVKAVRDADQSAGVDVVEMKADITRAADGLEEHLSRRLAAEGPDQLTLFRLESESIEVFKRIYYFAKRIGKVVAEA